MRFCVCLGMGAVGGERARVRIAEVWALKRKVSANSTAEEEVEADCFAEGVMVAVSPCRMRS